MKKETIKLSEVHKYDYPEDLDGYKLIKEDQTDFDAEKGFVDKEVVIQRLEDGKYFKFTYTQFGHNGSDLLEQTAEEVIRKEKTIYIYE